VTSPGELPPSLVEAVERDAGRILRVEALSGGCIANATRVDTTDGRVFLKWAAGPAGAGFEAEAAGLRALRACAPSDIVVPQPIACANAADGRDGYLLTSWVERVAPTASHSARLGAALAALHAAEPPAADAGRPYGFDVDTFCGATRQPNAWMVAWPDFFRERRLGALADALRRAGRWDDALDALFEAVLAALDRMLPARPQPSLVHGDLWSGNAFSAAGGATALVDPAAYVGHREVDLAMTELFGGFDASFYAAYREAWPLEPGYEHRREVYNLYRLMNHALIFGGGYQASFARSVRSIADRVLPGAAGRRH
jgi:fructosamine-3-kinase